MESSPRSETAPSPSAPDLNLRGILICRAFGFADPMSDFPADTPLRLPVPPSTWGDPPTSTTGLVGGPGVGWQRTQITRIWPSRFGTCAAAARSSQRGTTVAGSARYHLVLALMALLGAGCFLPLVAASIRRRRSSGDPGDNPPTREHPQLINDAGVTILLGLTPAATTWPSIRFPSSTPKWRRSSMSLRRLPQPAGGPGP